MKVGQQAQMKVQRKVQSMKETSLKVGQQAQMKAFWEHWKQAMNKTKYAEEKLHIEI